MFYHYYENDDPFNIAKERNTMNTDRGEYNCGGYALGCYSWYCPFAHQVRDFEKNVNQILKDFRNTRLVDNIQDLMPNEYMIAFRLSSDDFHFMKRAKNGVWREKRGEKVKFVLFLSLLYLVKYGRHIDMIRVIEEKLLSSRSKSNLLLFYIIRRSTSNNIT